MAVVTDCQSRSVAVSHGQSRSVTSVNGHPKREAAVLVNGQGFSRGEPHGFHLTKKEIHVANNTNTRDNRKERNTQNT